MPIIPRPDIFYRPIVCVPPVAFGQMFLPPPTTWHPEAVRPRSHKLSTLEGKEYGMIPSKATWGFVYLSSETIERCCWWRRIWVDASSPECEFHFICRFAATTSTGGSTFAGPINMLGLKRPRDLGTRLPVTIIFYGHFSVPQIK